MVGSVAVEGTMAVGASVNALDCDGKHTVFTPAELHWLLPMTDQYRVP